MMVEQPTSIWSLARGLLLVFVIGIATHHAVADQQNIPTLSPERVKAYLDYARNNFYAMEYDAARPVLKFPLLASGVEPDVVRQARKWLDVIEADTSAPPDSPSSDLGKSTEDLLLPLGLESISEPAKTTTSTDDVAEHHWQFDGFAELRYGRRFNSDPQQRDTTLSEGRLHLDFEFGEKAVTSLVTDIVFDQIEQEDIDLRTGEGAIDLRNASILFRATDNTDVKVGRQILTWGLGDQLFVNDIFPKDQLSFILGRDDNYLKVPADAIRVSHYSDRVNFDIAVLPIGATNRIVNGSRISFASDSQAQENGSTFLVQRSENAEGAVRLYRSFGAYETAAYGFWGRWKSPERVNPSTGEGSFPRLNAYGASGRGPIGGGIASIELAYYDSRDDPMGLDPNTANSEWRTLIGHDREILPETTLGMQYMSIVMLDYAEYQSSLENSTTKRSRQRDIVTLRLSRLFNNQTVRSSGFLYHSPSDGDGYLRFTMNYLWDDHWTIGGGVNIFSGDTDTVYGQFHDASNGQLFIRYGR